MLRMEFQELYWENKSSVFLDNIEFPIDVLVRNKNFVRNLEIKDLCDFDKDGLDLDRETVDDIGFIETIFHHGMSKSALDSPGFGVSSGEISDSSINKVTSTSIINLGHSTKEMGFGTVFEHNNEKESMIGKELDKYADSKEVSSMLSSEESLISSLMEHSLPTKRARNTGLYPQIPICQVQGCYKDLSSSKDYYKRHRVCDIHSKTAKVVINGIEQRFCQQCSRFHLLVEFDNGKRSCRKRLAGHNERRRKPQLGAHLGSRFFEMTLLRSTSFRSSETLPGSFYYQERNVCYDHSSKHIKLEQVPIDISQLAEPENGQSPSNSRPILHLIRNQHYLETCNDGPVELELPMLPDSRCALSLLSANSHNNHSMGVSKRTSPSTRENQNTLVGVYQKSAKAFTGNRHFSSGTQNQVGSPMVRSGFQKDGHIQTSDYTMDLFQLSSHLQRVEKLKSDMQMKQESYSSS